MKAVKLIVPGLVLFVSLVGVSPANAQGRFEAQWLFWSRNNDPDGPLINGPNAISADDNGFGFDSGFRFTAGQSFERFDIEASFMQIADWSDQENRILVLPVVFDDPTNAFIAPANLLAVPNNALRIAATLPALGEDNEIEFLEAGAAASTRYTSTFDSFELNLGTNRSTSPFWASVGYRHMELDEASSLLLVGTFQAMDIDGTLPGGGGNDPNDGLSHAALTGAGFGLIAGAGDGFLGYDPTLVAPVITTLGAQFQGRAQNDLDGVQVTVGGRMQPNDMLILEGFVKGGVYHNEASGLVRETVFGVVNDTSAYRRAFADRKVTAAFGGAIGFRVLVPLTDYISLITGYEALLLTNMALGPDQPQGIGATLLGAPRYDVVTNGLFVAHGGNLGVQATW